MTVVDLRGANGVLALPNDSDADLSITALDSAGAAVDLTGNTFSLDVMLDGSVAQAATMDHTDVATGIVLATFTAAELAALTSTGYTWRLRNTSADKNWSLGPCAISGSGSNVSATTTIAVTVDSTTVAITLGAIGAGTKGDDGDPGADGNTILNGTGAPDDGADGVNGDFYIDTSGPTLYGPKAAGAWGSGTSLVGPSGAGSGDVVGPGSATDSNFAAFDGTTGKLIKDSGSAAATFATASHNHAASDVTSGAFDAARLATGTATDTYVIASNSGTPTWTAASSGIGAVIDDQTLGSAAASVTFSSIPGTYASLVVAYQCRGDAAAAYRDFRVEFNGDTGSNYNTQYLLGYSTTAAGVAVDGTSPAKIGEIPAATASAGYAGDGSLELFNYAGTTFYKTAMYVVSREENGAAANRRHVRGHVTWESTAAVTQIKFTLNTGNFIAGSRFTLYGISGA